MRKAIVLVLCLAALSLQAAPVSIQGLRMADRLGGTRLVLDLAGPSGYKTFFLKGPERLVVDLQNSRLDTALSVSPTSDAYISKVRGAQRGEGARVVLDLKQPVSFTTFTLQPNQLHGHRLVIDVHPKKDGLGTGLPSTSQASSEPLESLFDPLEELKADHQPLMLAANGVTDLGLGAEDSATRIDSDDVFPDAFSVDDRWSGYIAGEYRYFPQNARASKQHSSNFSFAFEPEYYREWDGGNQGFTFKPFFRIDQQDTRRTHADIRELQWIKAGEGWEVRAGIGKVFWGVTEALHLVDVINQTDLIENPDGEQKLGQPMLKASLERDWGVLDFFVLPGFRERTFPGRHGRLRSQPYVDTDHARYESSAEELHTDLALRWSHSIGDWDLGLAHFWGTSREPTLLPGNARFTPYYEIINQTSLDVQATKGDWLWKMEALRRSGQGETWHAATGGFEYTFVGMMDSDADLGLLMEYMVDDRRESGPSPFQDDVFLALRWTANDVQSSELLAGVILDRDSGARLYNLEASRRLGADWKLTLQGRAWSNLPLTDPLSGLQRDDYLEFSLARFF